jgi:four helix bundle protein
MNSDELRSKTKDFAIDTIRFIKTLSRSFEEEIIARQLLKSGTSMASNYRATCRSRSKVEFYSKQSIVVVETDETMFWLEILTGSGIADNNTSQDLLKRSTEIIKIFSSARKTVGIQLSKNDNLNHLIICPGGGTGRHAGLKIL